ncbi:MAG: hypothetical protein VXW32_02140 [Myxococcota bacterium]|nr:hypothetical protein [Myxococcota bacterium]
MNALLLLAACFGPEGGSHYQDQWMVLGLNSDSSILDVRLSTGNSGMLAGGGQVRADWVSLQDGGLGYARQGLRPDVTVSTGGIAIGPDSLKNQSDEWVLRIQSGELDSRVQLTNTLLEAPQSLDNDWRMSTLFAGPMQGVIRAQNQSALLQGYAVGIRAWGTTPPSLAGKTRRSAFVLAEDLAIGIDQVGSQATGFAVVAGQQLDASTAMLRKDEGIYVLDFQPAADLEVRITPRKPHRQTSPWDHLYAIERWIASLRYGRPVHRVRAGQASVRLGDRQLEARAVIAVNGFID